MVAPAAPNIVLCYLSGSAPSDLFLSINGGKTWGSLAPQPTGTSTTLSFVLTPTTPPRLLAFADASIFIYDPMRPSTDVSGMPAATMAVSATTSPPHPSPLDFTQALLNPERGGAAAATGLGPAGEAAYIETGAAIVPFEQGAMVYLPGRNAFFVLLNTPGNPLVVVPRTFDDTGLITALAPGPRPNTFVPRLGFGKVWQDNASLQQQLGFATGDERRLSVTVQCYQNGIVVADTANASVYVFNTAMGIWDSSSL